MFFWAGITLFISQLFMGTSPAQLVNYVAEPIFVSLGADCEVAIRLGENNLRKSAFPFDWLLILNDELFIQMLDDDFCFFTQDEYLIRHPLKPQDIDNYYYNIKFKHDWPFPDLYMDQFRERIQIEELKTKYERRIARFRELKNYQGKVIFFRAALSGKPKSGSDNLTKINDEQTRKLKDALDRYFPNLEFTLVIVNHVDTFDQKLEKMNGVREFKIRKSNKGDDYREMFLMLTND